eukprot:gene14983-biopygen15054
MRMYSQSLLSECVPETSAPGFRPGANVAKDAGRGVKGAFVPVPEPAVGTGSGVSPLEPYLQRPVADSHTHPRCSSQQQNPSQ